MIKLESPYNIFTNNELNSFRFKLNKLIIKIKCALLKRMNKI